MTSLSTLIVACPNIRAMPRFYSRGFVSLDVLGPNALPIDVLDFSDRPAFIRVDLGLYSILEVSRSIDIYDLALFAFAMSKISDLIFHHTNRTRTVRPRITPSIVHVGGTMMADRMQSLPELDHYELETRPPRSKCLDAVFKPCQRPRPF